MSKYECQTSGLHQFSPNSCIGCAKEYEEKYDTMMKFLKVQAFFSSSEETLQKLAARGFEDYITFRSKTALQTRELLRKIGELND